MYNTKHRQLYIALQLICCITFTSASYSYDFDEIKECMNALISQNRQPVSVTSGRVQCAQTDIVDLGRVRHDIKSGSVELKAPVGYKIDKPTITSELAHHEYCHFDGLDVSDTNAIGRYHCISRPQPYSGGTDCGMTIKGMAFLDYEQISKEERNKLFEKCMTISK